MTKSTGMGTSSKGNNLETFFSIFWIIPRLLEIKWYECSKNKKMHNSQDLGIYDINNSPVFSRHVKVWCFTSSLYHRPPMSFPLDSTDTSQEKCQWKHPHLENPHQARSYTSFSRISLALWVCLTLPSRPITGLTCGVLDWNSNACQNPNKYLCFKRTCNAFLWHTGPSQLHLTSPTSHMLHIIFQALSQWV